MRSTLNIVLLALARSILAQEAPIALECVDNDLVESIPDDSDFSFLKAALQYVEFDSDTVINNQSFTLLAPTNEALAQLFPNIGTNGLASLQPAFVTEILLNHLIVGTAIRAQQIIEDPAIQSNPIITVLETLRLLPEETVEGLDEDSQEFIAGIKEDCESGVLEVEVDGDLVIFSSGATSEAVVTTADITLCQGVVHAINTVLVPSCEIKDADLTATPPSIAALGNIDVEGAAPALGIGSLLDDEPITAPAVNAIPFDMAPMPAPAEGPALEPEVEDEAPGPALDMGEEIEPDSEGSRDIDIEGPAGGPEAALPPAVVDTEAPLAPGVAEPPTATVDPDTATPVEGPAAAEPPTVVVDPATPPPEADLAPVAGVPTIAVASRAGVADVEAPGPAVAFFAETFDTRVETSVLSPEAAEALTTEPGFSTVEVAGEEKLCIDLEELPIALEQLSGSTPGVSFQTFINLITKSDDLLDILTDPETTATVFIPIQQGITYLKDNYPEFIDASGDNLVNQLLRYHIIPGFNTPAAEFAAEEFDEPLPAETLVSLDTCEETLSIDVPAAGSVEVNGVPVIQADLVSCDSRIVFHIIEGILIPQCGSTELVAAREASAEAIKAERLDETPTDGTRDLDLDSIEPGAAPSEGPGGQEPGAEPETAEPPNSASIASMSISAAVAVAVALLA